MLAKIFKKAVTAEQTAPDLPVAIRKLDTLGVRNVFCTVTERPDGIEAHEEVGPAMFYARPGRLYTRSGSIYLAPPAGYRSESGLLRGEGEVVNLRFHHKRVPYSVDCRVMQRVRFTDRLMEVLTPRAAIGFRLQPIGPVIKNESRRSLRFAHIRGVKGPQVSPHFRFDLSVERVQLSRPDGPEVVPFPGDEPVPDEVRACESPADLIGLFHSMLRSNPEYLRAVHVSRVEHEGRSGRTELLDLGSLQVLGLEGESSDASIHVRRPCREDPKALRVGDPLVLNFVGRTTLRSIDVHYSWQCRVHRAGAKVLVLRPKGLIHQQTGLPVVVRDFSVNGVGIQNSPLLETYLLGDLATVPSEPDEIRQALEGTGLLMHFHPRLYYPNDFEVYRPHLPASIPVIGEIVRAQIEEGKEEGRISTLGVAFRFDPVDYDSTSLQVSAWEPLRALRENPHFKEAHRALNGLLAFLER